MGGMVEAVKRGYPQSEIANSAYHYQKLVEQNQKIIVGVNRYQQEEAQRNIKTLYIGQKVEKEQREKLAALKRKRSKRAWEDSLRGVEIAAGNDENMMESITTAVRAKATLQEICDVMRKVYGEYREAGSF